MAGLDGDQLLGVALLIFFDASQAENQNKFLIKDLELLLLSIKKLNNRKNQLFLDE